MKSIFGVIALLSSVSAMADDDNGKALDLSAELGILSISGNSDSSSVKTKLDIKHDLTNWRNSYLIEGLYKEDTIKGEDGVKEDVLSAKKYFASAQTDYKLNEKHRGLFMFASYTYDRFSGYDYQATLAAGYSDQLFKTDSSFLNYSIGPGLAITEVGEDKEEKPILRVSASYRYKISEGAKFTQELSSDVATESGANTKTKSETALSAQLNSSLALKLAFSVSHNTEVPLGIESTDTQTAVTVVYSY